MEVRVVEEISRENDSVMDGAFYCWAQPSEDEDDGVFPFVCDLPDRCTYGEIKIPQTVTLQITGFAHELSAYKNHEEFDNSQESIPKFASESFLPTGLFMPNGDRVTPPEAYALFNGHVLETSTIINQLTNKKFHWAKINTLGGEIDIVADPEILEGELTIGGVVSGTFWLSARIIGDFLTEEKFSIRKLLKRIK